MAEALIVRRSSTQIMEDHVLVRLGERTQESEPIAVDETNRLKVMIAVGTAFAVNCVSNLKKQLTAAEAVGLTHEEIVEILNLSKFIKGKGASHVERLGGMLE